jgi:hypothetical protein
MSREERSGSRDLTFSRWHRTLPDFCTCIDLDFLEYCQRCRRPLALIEIARGHHGMVKPTTVLKALADLAGIAAYLVLYDIDESALHGINKTVRAQKITPDRSDVREITLTELGLHIEKIHLNHSCVVKVKETP